jgi:hypothetical protein
MIVIAIHVGSFGIVDRKWKDLPSVGWWMVTARVGWSIFIMSRERCGRFYSILCADLFTVAVVASQVHTNVSWSLP